MDNSKAKLAVFFVGLKDPKPWNINGNSGISYKATIITAKKKEPVSVKVSEQLYKTLSEHVGFMEEIILVFSDVVVQGELKFLPDTYEYPEQAKTAAD